MARSAQTSASANVADDPARMPPSKRSKRQPAGGAPLEAAGPPANPLLQVLASTSSVPSPGSLPLAGLSRLAAADRQAGKAQIERWRSALLGTIAASALLVYGGRSAQAACVDSGAGTLTCTGPITGDAAPGVVNGGINVPAGFTTLNVNSLTTNIAPDVYTNGITFSGTGNIVVNSDTTDGSTPHVIHATGAFANGMLVSSDGNVTINSTGDITSDGGRAITANSSAGTVSITSAGTLDAGSAGIVVVTADGAVQVGSTGDITTGTESGIQVFSDGGNVEVTSSGTINSGTYGIWVQSATGSLTVDNTGAITSTNGGGIFANSFGPAAAGADVSITHQGGDIQSQYAGLRAASSSSLSANSVSIVSTGDITSDTRQGIYAYTRGSGAVSVTSNGNLHGFLYGIVARSGNSTLDNGGQVTVHSTGDIRTDERDGILALSQGAGAVEVTSNGNITSARSGIRAESYDGAVTVKNTGDISAADGVGITAGNFLTGGTGDILIENDGNVHASSLGIGADSDSGAVTVTSNGNITSDTSTGIAAGNRNGTAAVSLTNDGNVSAHTLGLVANSQGGDITLDSTGNVTSATSDAIQTFTTATSSVTVHGGNVHGAVNGVNFALGSTNTLLNYGAISGDQFAVRSGTGTTDVDNFGVIAGNVELAAGGNTFDNHAGATFRTGAVVNLGSNANVLMSDGTLSPGGTGTVVTTALTGSLVQTGTGTFLVDIQGTTADRITANATATVDGVVTPHVISTSGSTGSAVIASGTSLTSSAVVFDTPAYDFTLSVIDGDKLLLEWHVLSILALLNGPLTPNQEVTALYLDTLRMSGASAALQAVLDAIIGLPNEAEIRAALDRLHPEHYLAHVNDTLLSSLFFLNSVMSCPKADGAPGLVAEGECYWAKVGARAHDWDRTWSNIGGSEEAYSFSAGLQFALTDNWRLGFAASYENTSSKTNNAASTDGERAEAAVVLKSNWGATSFAAAAFGGYGWFETKRLIGVGGIGFAEGDHDIAFGGVHTRLSHVLAQGNAYDGNWYVKPMIDLNATYLDFGGFNETGAGAVGLAVRGESDWVFSASPALELGAEWRGTNGSVTRPYVRVGATFLSDADFSLTSGFIGAPAGVTPFTVTSNFDDVYVDLGAGIDVLNLSGVDLKLNYDGRFAKDSEMHSGGIKLGVKY